MKCNPFPSGVPIIKRLLDYILTLPFLLIFAPIYLLISVLISIFLGKPIFFTQIRPGFKARPFKLFKFRTMRHLIDAQGRSLPDEERLTRLGKFLRATSLDEFPELINVIKGEMSLVGPRPLLMEYLPRYSTEQARRHDVLPGITGWAQIHGRNTLSWEEKFELDVWYVEHWSLWLDIKILFTTFGKVLKQEGISQPGNATAEKFLGTQKLK